MSTIELFITSILATAAICLMLGALALRLWLAHLDRKDRHAMRAMSRQLRNINDRTDRLEYRCEHLGTPYRRETLVAAATYTSRAGVRVTKGQPMFSSDWLNDGLGPAALPPTELRSAR